MHEQQRIVADAHHIVVESPGLDRRIRLAHMERAGRVKAMPPRDGLGVAGGHYHDVEHGAGRPGSGGDVGGGDGEPCGDVGRRHSDLHGESGHGAAVADVPALQLADDGGGTAPVEDRPDGSPQADEVLERAQEAQILRTAISTLPPGAQRALRLHRFDGHSQGEVAEIRGISRSGVEKHLVVAMKYLRNALRDCGLMDPAASDAQGQAGGTEPPTELQR